MEKWARRRNTFVDWLGLWKRRQDSRSPKWVRVGPLRGGIGRPSGTYIFYWRVPRTSSWAKFFGVPPGLVNAHEMGVEGRRRQRLESGGIGRPSGTHVFYWCVPRTSSWAKFFGVPPGLVFDVPPGLVHVPRGTGKCVRD